MHAFSTKSCVKTVMAVMHKATMQYTVSAVALHHCVVLSSQHASGKQPYFGNSF